MRPPRIPRTVLKGCRRPDPRRAADGHRVWIKTLPCLGCGRRPPSDPAHLRFNEADPVLKGAAGRKPPNRLLVPLCRACHDSEERGKLTFWGGCMSKGISDPIGVAGRLWLVSGDTERGFAAIQHARPGMVTAWL